MADDEEKAKAEKLAAARKRVSGGIARIYVTVADWCLNDFR